LKLIDGDKARSSSDTGQKRSSVGWVMKIVVLKGLKDLAKALNERLVE